MQRKLGGSTKVWVKPGVSGYETFARVGQFLATATIDQLDTMALFGDPQRCVERIRPYEAVGVTHLLVMFDWGGFPQHTVFHAMELFAKYVMPCFPPSDTHTSAPDASGEPSTAQAVAGE